VTDEDEKNILCEVLGRGNIAKGFRAGILAMRRLTWKDQCWGIELGETEE
jgi:hypothetical protein